MQGVRVAVALLAEAEVNDADIATAGWRHLTLNSATALSTVVVVPAPAENPIHAGGSRRMGEGDAARDGGRRPLVPQRNGMAW